MKLSEKGVEEGKKFKCFRVLISVYGVMGEEVTHRLHEERKIRRTLVRFHSWVRRRRYLGR